MTTAVIIILIVSLVAIPCIAALPTITISYSAVTTSSVYSFIRGAMYFLPVKTVGIILSLILALWLFRMLIAIIRAVWAILPFA